MNFINKLKINCFEVKKIRIVILLVCSLVDIYLFVAAGQNVYDYRKIILAFIAYVILTVIKLETTSFWYNLYSEVVMIVTAMASFMVMELICFNAITWDWWRVIINAVPVYVLGKVVHLLTRSLKGSVAITLVGVMIYSLASYYVWEFRGQPILPWDISAVATAATVASTYEFFVTKFMVYSFMICSICFMATFVVQCKEMKKIRWGYSLCQLLLIGLIINSYMNYVYPTLLGNMWNMGIAYHSDGMVGGFLGHVRYCQVDKPLGYEKSEVEEKIEDAEEVSASGEVVAENIIVIMNESFADFRVINDELVSDEYMPFVDSLTENTIKGNLAVPIFGGNTCDSEFEVLLSASTSFATPIPYQTAINTPTESLVSYLKERGFYAEAFHPYIGSNWNRITVYNSLGFDEFIDMNSLENPQYVRWCINDKTDYKKLIEEYEEHNDKKFFMFNVTMQNHGGYEEEYDNFPITVDLSSYEEYPQAETYFSLVKESDDALQGLIEYFSEVDEPTLICFFGDHYPSIETEFYNLLYGKDVTQLTPVERQAMYATPMIIWTNYDIEEKNIGTISSNFLALEILKAANIELDGYYSVLNDIYEAYSVISINGVFDRQGNWYDLNAVGDVEEILWQKKLQYYRIYD